MTDNRIVVLADCNQEQLALLQARWPAFDFRRANAPATDLVGREVRVMLTNKAPKSLAEIVQGYASTRDWISVQDVVEFLGMDTAPSARTFQRRIAAIIKGWGWRRVNSREGRFRKWIYVPVDTGTYGTPRPIWSTWRSGRHRKKVYVPPVRLRLRK